MHSPISRCHGQVTYNLYGHCHIAYLIVTYLFCFFFFSIFYPNRWHETKIIILTLFFYYQFIEKLGKIEFLDTDGERFAITVYGCTDNSIMTNYPFIQRFSKSFGFLNIENQAIKFIKNEEIKILMLKDKEYKDCAAEYQKESERLEQEALLGKGGNKGRSPSHVSKDGKSKIITRQEPEKPTYVMGQSSNQYCPDFSENSNSNDDDVFWKEGLTGLLDTEAIVILKWLNKFVCKKPFLIDKFPKCILDSYGDIFVDFIEQISGRKIPGVKVGPGDDPAVRRGDNKEGSGSGVSRPINRLSQRIAGALRLSAKFSLILSHLISGGALLNHINAIDLLRYEDHLLAQEVDLRKCEGDRMTPATLDEQKILWEKSWKANCTFGWMEVTR